jgi:predicted HTH domain antitoxin
MKITLDIPDELTQHHSFSQADWLREIAVALFQQEHVTLGTASNIAGMHQMQFQELLYDRGINLHYDIADYQADIESLRQNHWR